MQISKREKNVLLLAGFVAVVFVISSVFPAIRGIYQDRNEAIEDIHLNIERERRLFDDTITWRGRRTEVESTLEGLEAQVFSGETGPIIEANIQQALTQYARDSEISVTSTRLADRLEAQGWIMVSQEMSFRTVDAANTISFLRQLSNSVPRLWVTDFSIDRARNQYSGSITAVGFARSEGLSVQTAQVR
ncbi:MAG: hypothetical protein JKY98_10965 [Gammaproteobacteria bacterium]|nr:hypothetical protein [Gammaproteobacteria bacterium]